MENWVEFYGRDASIPTAAVRPFEHIAVPRARIVGLSERSEGGVFLQLTAINTSYPIIIEINETFESICKRLGKFE